MRIVAMVAALALLAVALGNRSAPSFGQTPPNQGKVAGDQKPVPPHPLDDALLWWDFNLNSFFQDKGLFYVKDASGHGNHGRYRDMERTVPGREGGALKNDGKGWLQSPISFIKHSPSFTITAWVRWDDGDQFNLVSTYLSNGFPKRREALFLSYIQANASIQAGAFNYQSTEIEKWRKHTTAGKLFEKNDWTFVAIRMEGTKSGSGKLHLQVNDHKETAEPIQVAGQPLGSYFDLFAFQSKGAIDDVAVWNRCLADRELDVLRKGDPKPTRREAVPPAKPAQFPKPMNDAKLVLTFESSTFRESNGKTEVLDQSGNGNHALCENVDFTFEGKAGGGLHSEGQGQLRLAKSLINGQANFTVAGWIRFDSRVGYLYDTVRTNAPLDKLEPVFHLGLSANALNVAAWHTNFPKNWLRAKTDVPFEKGKWYFLAFVLRNCNVGQGQLRIRINDKAEMVNLQMVKGLAVRQDLIGRGVVGTIDELAVWQRALSDEELDVLYRSNGRLMHPKDVRPQPEKAKSP